MPCSSPTVREDYAQVVPIPAQARVLGNITHQTPGGLAIPLKKQRDQGFNKIDAIQYR